MDSKILARWWHNVDGPGWRSFAIAMVALAAALFLAVYSGVAAEGGHLAVAAISALAALALAGWVGLTIVPVRGGLRCGGSPIKSTTN